MNTTATPASARALFDCVAACERCIDACLAQDTPSHAACIRACRDCIDACLLAARWQAAHSPLAAEATRLCQLACAACAEACANAGCNDCASTCRGCADACD